MAASRKGTGLVVDTDTLVMRRDRVLVQHVPGAVLILGYGRRANALRRFAYADTAQDAGPFLSRCEIAARDIESGKLIKARRAGLPRAIAKIGDRALRRLAIAEALAKAGFNSDEPRDERGRWTSGGGTDAKDLPAEAGNGLPSPNVTSASTVAAGIARGGTWELGGNLTPEIFADLAQLALRFSAPTVFLGTLFLPTNIGRQTSGTVEGRPDLSFHYDGDTGDLTLARDGVAFLTSQNIYGLFHDDQGRVIGRFVEGHIVFDADALPAPSQAAALAGGSLVRTDADRLEPKLCPATVPESIKGRSARAILYQVQISNLPPGLAVAVHDPVTGTPVQFDGCCTPDNANCVRDGVVLDYLLEAKGQGFQNKLQDSENWKEWFTGGKKIEAQMERQNDVAGATGWEVEWNFAEPLPAAFFARYASENEFDHIHVRYTPLRQP